MPNSRKYSCAQCSGKVSKPPCVAPKHKGKDAKVTYSGLGGWSCENCGTKTREVSVIRDLSGGKEADKGNRSVSVRATRSLQIRVSLGA